MKLALPQLNVTLDLAMKPKKGKQLEMAIARKGGDTEIDQVFVCLCVWGGGRVDLFEMYFSYINVNCRLSI